MLFNILVSLGIVLLFIVGVSIIITAIIFIGFNIEKYLDKKRNQLGKEKYEKYIWYIKIVLIVIVFITFLTTLVYKFIFVSLVYYL